MEQSPFNQVPIWPTNQEQEPAPLANRFLQAGREGKNDWWRYLLGILLSFLVGYAIIGAIPLAVLAFIKLPFYEVIKSGEKLTDPDFLHVNKNLLLVFVLFIFVAAAFFLWIAVRFIHKKRFMAIIASDRQPFSWSRYFTGFGIWIGFSIITLGIMYAMEPESFTLVIDPANFFVCIIVCLIMLPIQTGWEEVFFRGYLLQGLGLWLKKPLWPVIITGLIFGLMHMANTEVSVHGVAEMLPQYVLPGLVFGIIAALDERLELAMGIHFANNLFGILTITSPEMSIKAYAIWQVPSLGGGLSTILGLVPHLIVLLLLVKIYKWNFNKLLQ
jgi:uncharacterized protein